MKSSEIISNSPQETKKIAADLAESLGHQPLPEHAFIVALEGNLGSGKTTFIQGMAEGFKIKENVLSPTFLILKQFPISGKNYINFYHIDAYRLKNPRELLELGFADLIKNPENLIIIEWADKVEKILSKDTLWIRFENLGKNKRKVIL